MQLTGQNNPYFSYSNLHNMKILVSELRKPSQWSLNFCVENLMILLQMSVKVLSFLLRYKQKLEGHPLSNSSLARAFLDWAHKDSNNQNAADSWYETSGHGLTEYQECKGKQTWAWKSGYSTVLDLLKVRHSEREKHSTR
jgi:hypothetical protein